MKIRLPEILLVCVLSAILTAGLAVSPKCQEYLSDGDVAAIGTGSIAAGLAGHWALRLDSTRSPLIDGPLPLERKLQTLLGGRYHVGKTNFLDNSFGSAVTPLSTGAMLLAADLAWPQGDKTKTTLQDQYLFVTGLMATGGITSLLKGVVARKRPVTDLHPELADQRREIDYNYDRQSFFSGHTSSAFFSAAFANMRFRSIMRTQLSPSEYKDWRWAPPTILFGWASFVGWSRIHAYKHYLSDVIVGALAGYLMAELFHSFGDYVYGESGEGGITPVVKFRFSF